LFFRLWFRAAYSVGAAPTAPVILNILNVTCCGVADAIKLPVVSDPCPNPLGWWTQRDRRVIWERKSKTAEKVPP